MNMNPNTLLIIAGMIAIVIELMLGVATGFDLFVLGVIFILAGTIGTMTGSFTIALWATIVLTILYIAIARKFIKQKLSIATTATNSDGLVGREAIVVKAIDKHKAGQVKIEGEIWRAEASTSLKDGEHVKIDSISGVTLKVKELRT